MASIRKVKNKWLVEVRIKSFYQSKRFDTKSEAKNWANAIELQAYNRKSNKTDYSFEDAINRYLKEVSPTHKSHRWEILRSNIIKRDGIVKVKLSNLSTDKLQTWVDERTKKLSSGTINRELTFLSSVLETARKVWKWNNDQPIKDLIKPKQPPPRDRRISDYEIALILDKLNWYETKPIETIQDEIAIGFLLAIETAMRRGELWGLTWDRVFLDKRYVILNNTKNGTKREVPLTLRAIELFEKLKKREEQINKQVFLSKNASVDAMFRKSVRRANIENLHFHDTRPC